MQLVKYHRTLIRTPALTAAALMETVKKPHGAEQVAGENITTAISDKKKKKEHVF